ncbi:MAG: type II secretion system GspH family protein [Marinobacter sp.]|nr:type II secretion system GspH family protein [Marinobacter sp.]
MTRPQRGATLIELVMSIVIISLAIAGVTSAFALLAGRSADPLDQTRAVALAQLYMDEILTKAFDHNTPPGGVPPYSGACNIGPEPGETRATYNDVDDYDGIDNAVPSTPLGPLVGYEGFRVSISVSCAGGDLALPASEAKRIDLTIDTPGGQSFAFAAYRVNF